MCISENTLQKKLKALTGITPLAYLNRYRLHKASVYLRDSDLMIQAIIVKVGFSDAPNFTRLFKKYEHQTPREYRAQVAGPNA